MIAICFNIREDCKTDFDISMKDKNMNSKLELWKNFCKIYIDSQVGIPLFETTNNIVSLKEYGKNNRLILKRSLQMEFFLIQEVNKVLEDFQLENDYYEGLIYMMYFYEKNIVIPLYIGKSEKYGKQGNNLSSNIENISKNKHRFCRWGDNYAYHIGDLSAVVCPNHPETKIQRKYKKWAKKIFENYPTYEPKLKKPVYFWIMAWQKGNRGIFQDFGGTPLTALEYQLISVASTVFPNELLNYEGVNRRQEYIWFLLIQIYSEIINQKILSM